MATSNSKLYFLVGMPGAGKTYWGRQLAEVQGMDFIDLDEYIEEKEGISISQLFALNGEQWFREKEALYLYQIIAHTETNAVLACGGGTPCYHHNMQLMKSHGVTIYLDVPLATLATRLKDDRQGRPMFKSVRSLELQLEELYVNRTQYYEQARYKLHNDEMSLDALCSLISST